MLRLAPRRLLLAACALALVGLILVAWSVLVPKPIPVILAMTLAQILGTVSLGLYVLAIVIDLRRANVLADEVPPKTAEEVREDQAA